MTTKFDFGVAKIEAVQEKDVALSAAEFIRNLRTWLKAVSPSTTKTVWPKCEAHAKSRTEKTVKTTPSAPDTPVEDGAEDTDTAPKLNATEYDFAARAAALTIQQLPRSVAIIIKAKYADPELEDILFELMIAAKPQSRQHRERLMADLTRPYPAEPPKVVQRLQEYICRFRVADAAGLVRD